LCAASAISVKQPAPYLVSPCHLLSLAGFTDLLVGAKKTPATLWANSHLKEIPAL